MSAKRSSLLPSEDGEICAGDCCQDAVRRAYREMRGKGEPESFAMGAALTVFAWHHPEIEAPRARDTIALWVHDGTMH